MSTNTVIQIDREPDYPAVLDAYRRHLSRGRAKISEVFGTQLEVSARGAWVETSDGGRYLNAGGYGVFIHGARHPHVEAAVIRQIQTNPIASRILLEPQAARAAEALARSTPDGLEHVHFACSGTEATEAAIKLARTSGRRRLVSTNRGYHGKTLGSLSVTANSLYQDPFRPLLPDVSHVPFGDAGCPRGRAANRTRGLRHPRTGPGRGRRDHSARRLPARGARRSATSTARSSSWTRSRPDSAGSAPGGAPTARA